MDALCMLQLTTIATDEPASASGNLASIIRAVSFDGWREAVCSPVDDSVLRQSSQPGSVIRQTLVYIAAPALATITELLAFLLYHPCVICESPDELLKLGCPAAGRRSRSIIRVPSAKEFVLMSMLVDVLKSASVGRTPCKEIKGAARMLIIASRILRPSHSSGKEILADGLIRTQYSLAITCEPSDLPCVV